MLARRLLASWRANYVTYESTVPPRCHRAAWSDSASRLCSQQEDAAAFLRPVLRREKMVWAAVVSPNSVSLSSTQVRWEAMGDPVRNCLVTKAEVGPWAVRKCFCLWGDALGHSQPQCVHRCCVRTTSWSCTGSMPTGYTCVEPMPSDQSVSTWWGHLTAALVVLVTRAVHDCTQISPRHCQTGTVSMWAFSSVSLCADLCRWKTDSGAEGGGRHKKGSDWSRQAIGLHLSRWVRVNQATFTDDRVDSSLHRLYI